MYIASFICIIWKKSPPFPLLFLFIGERHLCMCKEGTILSIQQRGYGYGYTPWYRSNSDQLSGLNPNSNSTYILWCFLSKLRVIISKPCLSVKRGLFENLGVWSQSQTWPVFYSVTCVYQNILQTTTTTIKQFSSGNYFVTRGPWWPYTAHPSIMAQNGTEKYSITYHIFLLAFLYIGKLMGTL